MKAVICADLHIDKAERLRNGTDALAERRRLDTRDTFMRIIGKVQSTGAAFLFIAGDLFDASHAKADLADFLKNAFLSVPDTYVFISPGNNDPYTRGSIYETTAWPDNVHVFRRGLEAVEVQADGERVRVYGAGFTGNFTKEPFITGRKKITLDDGCINILLMHGSDDPESKSNYIDPELLDAAGFDFCALGHIHRYSGLMATGKTFYAYTGTPEEQGFMGEARTPGGILTGEIGKFRHDLVFEEISSRRHRTCKINVSDIPSPERLVNAIRTRYPYLDDMVRVILTGTAHPSVLHSLDKIKDILKPDYFYLEIIDRTSSWAPEDLNRNRRLTKIINDIAAEECLDSAAPGRAVEALNHPEIQHL